MLEPEQRTISVICPCCDQPMEPAEQKAILFSDGLADVTFVCEICRTWSIQTLKLDEDPVF